ncbi:MAG: phenylacetate--CoA ligase family protein [Candidatus Marinimicrobia bacterium]|nr:phenylacetate--CoA ligase family protein [Candidatus Neomarinimicrobiota bacterium]MBL7109956.1 phenylacetate--CoA ligase family protein [Candidatus Neomarinimicrobiota bacterium]
MKETIIRSAIFTFADKLSGFNIIPRVKQLVDSEKLSNIDREELQLRKLKKLLIHSQKTVPYYRDLFKRLNIYPEKPDSLDILREIPILKKTQIKKCPEIFLSELFKNKQLFWGQTGGSTGQPLSYALDPNCRVQVRAGFYRAMTWVGWKPGDSIVSFWGRPIIKDFRSSVFDKLKSFVLNYTEIDAHILDEKSLYHYTNILKRKSPKIVIGYASTLNLLADFIQQNNVNLENDSIDGVFSTAEMLLDPMKSNIEKAFNTKVFNSYGASEIQAIADTCHNGNMHIHSERVILRNFENSLLVTDLDNYAMPLINYKLDDNGTIAKTNQCKCGRTLPVLENLVGRSNINILLPNGKIVHSEYFTHLLEQLDIFKKYRVNCFQIHQFEDYRISIKLNSLSDLNETDKLKMQKIIQRDFSNNIQIDFEKLEILNSSSKFKFITSDLV